jgi:GGDEF domain-containing protein
MLLLEVAVADVRAAQFAQFCEDEVLRTVAERLHAEVPEPMLVTRLRGGTFAVVLRDLGPEVTPDALATRLLERASGPWQGGEMSTCTVAGALVLSDGGQETAIQLLDRALRMLGRAKLGLAGRAR